VLNHLHGNNAVLSNSVATTKYVHYAHR